MEWDRILLTYKQAADELKAKFENISLQFTKLEHNSPIHRVEARVKTIPSVLAKARRKNISMDEIQTQMWDIAGIRIICRFVDDIKTVVNIIKDRQDMEIVEDRDYVAQMKPSGYRGYHLLVRYPVYTVMGRREVLCEIQIRTLAMNMWAVTEHSLRYKYKGLIPEEIHRRLVRTADAAFMLDTDTNVIKDDILEAEKSNQSREDIVLDITNAIEDLSNIIEPVHVEGLYNKFVDVMGTNEFKCLEEFHNEIKVIARAYKIR